MGTKTGNIYEEKKARPFLKWAGGKHNLLSQLKEFYPSEFNKYFEPFVGGGAVFFDLSPDISYLNDLNKWLIQSFIDIRDNLEEVIERLDNIEKEYLALEQEKRKEFYYSVRRDFNNLNTPSLKSTLYLIFLNKTCFNGMYRENSKSEFNVPFGSYKNPTILDEDNLVAVNKKLQNTELTSISFEDSLKRVEKGDFVYFDPPYYPISKTSSFTKYNKDDFAKKEQITLKETMDWLHKKGVYVMLSNSSAPFIEKLYADYRKENVSANRSINSRSNKRGAINEFLILNY